MTWNQNLSEMQQKNNGMQTQQYLYQLHQIVLFSFAHCCVETFQVML